MLKVLLRFALPWAVLVPLVALAGAFDAKVVSIADGDTVTVLTAANEQIRIRLAEIDAPEGGQPWSNRSKQALAALVHGRTVRVEPLTTDRYGRTVARLYVGNIDVSAELVRQGHAWVFRRYVTDESLFAVEEEARAAGRGMWSLPEFQRVPPWEWRAARQQLQPATGSAIMGSEGAPIIGNRRSGIYHRPDCPNYHDVAERNRVYFNTPAEAEAAGFRAARNC